MATNAPSRSYVFTINNYTDDDLTVIADLDPEDGNISYLIAGFEIGEQGTPHIQGYVECKPTRFAAMNKLLGGRAYLEKRRGTRDQARDYCKKDGQFIEIGNWKVKGQGRRTDLEEFMGDIKKGASLKDIAEKYPANWLRFNKGATIYKSMVDKEKAKEFRKLEVTVIWGSAGCGKTRYVREHENEVFFAPGTKGFEFEGYGGEEAVCLDDFYGGIPYHELLRLLDGYQKQLNVKGGHTYALYTRVYITSNQPPEDWYKNTYGFSEALKRRVNKIVHVDGTTVTEKCLRTETDSDGKLSFSHETTKCYKVVGNNEATTLVPSLEDKKVEEFVFLDFKNEPSVSDVDLLIPDNIGALSSTYDCQDQSFALPSLRQAASSRGGPRASLPSSLDCGGQGALYPLSNIRPYRNGSKINARIS